jgi:hypothetical protein
MSKLRVATPTAVKDLVLKEFNHRCAICGAQRPHLHHLDENPGNNAAENLIPLCPNCHLTDQHDASNAVPVEKLRFFRRHKHRSILKPQFNPIFSRMEFLFNVRDWDIERLAGCATELIELVASLAMGEFYAKQLRRRLERPSELGLWILGNPESEAQHRLDRAESDARYREQLSSMAPEVCALVVEALDYQTWPDRDSTDEDRKRLR